MQVLVMGKSSIIDLHGEFSSKPCLITGGYHPPSGSHEVTIWLVVLEHGFYFPIILGMSSSRLTNSYFSEGYVNHQPAIKSHKIPLNLYKIPLNLYKSHKIPLNPTMFGILTPAMWWSPPIHPSKHAVEAIGAGFSEARSTVGTRPYTAPEVLRDSEWRRWNPLDVTNILWLWLT